jgi:hypothetical protein
MNKSTLGTLANGLELNLGTLKGLELGRSRPNHALHSTAMDLNVRRIALKRDGGILNTSYICK